MTQMKSVSIDSLMRSESMPLTGMKVDVDGPDGEVFAGAMKIIERDNPLLLIETLPDEVKQKLLSLGYRCFSYTADRNMPWSLKFICVDDLSSRPWIKMTLCLPAPFVHLGLAQSLIKESTDRRRLKWDSAN